MRFSQIARGVQVSDRHALLRKEAVGLALRIEVRHVEALLENGHARAVSREEFARVLERRPDGMANARLSGGGRQGVRLRQLLFAGQVFPEIGDEEGAVGPFEGAQHAGAVVEIRQHDVGTGPGKLARRGPSGRRVTARTAKWRSLSVSNARARPPPCAPVAPKTAMTGLDMSLSAEIARLGEGGAG